MSFENNPPKKVSTRICRVTEGKFTWPKVCIQQQIPGWGASFEHHIIMGSPPLPHFSVTLFLPWEEGSGFLWDLDGAQMSPCRSHPGWKQEELAGSAQPPGCV